MTASPELLLWCDPWVAQFIKSDAEELGIGWMEVTSLHDLSKAVEDHRRQGTTTLNVVVDTGNIASSLEQVCRKLLEKDGRERLILLDRNAQTGKQPKANLELSREMIEEFGGQLMICSPTDADHGIDRLWTLMSQSIEETAEVDTEETRVLPSAVYGPQPETELPPNQLAEGLAQNLAQFSASIHIDREELRKNYVDMLQSATKVDADQHRDLLAGWRRYTAGRMKGSEDRLSPQRNALFHLHSILFIATRYTYLILGDPGCGKSTFLRFFFEHYLPEADPDRKVHHFFVDFLRYDFVRDAQELAARIQERVFWMRKERRTLPQDVEASSFQAFLASRDYTPSMLLDGEVPPDVELADGKAFLQTLLTGLDAQALAELYEKIQGTSPETPEEVERWKRVLLATLRASEVCRVIAELAAESLHRRERLIAEAIYEQARRDPTLRPILTRVGIEPQTARTQQGTSIEFGIRNFLDELRQEKEVCVVVDNADRVLRPAVELEIFRTAWEFIPNQYGEQRNVRLLFAMRRDTFHRHSAAFAQQLGAELSDIANPSNIILEAPRFQHVAHARVRSIGRAIEDAKEPDTANTLVGFVGGVLDSEIAEKLFDSLFGGDLRRCLELFEVAVQSPYLMKGRDQVELHRQIATGTLARRPKDYLKSHRLLLALMLGRWRTFRQSRSHSILNVYNAGLHVSAGENWRNTLAIPRALDVINTQPGRQIREKTLFMLFDDVLGYESDSVDQVLQVLQSFRLVDYTDTGKTPVVTLTRSGEYYVRELIHRLEYLQAVYWDTWVPGDQLFPDYKTPLELRQLHEFLLAFCDFIASEERRERKAAAAKGSDRVADVFSRDSLHARVQRTAEAQISKVLWSTRANSSQEG